MSEWANAVLKDGKIIFWWSDDKCQGIEDFYKDFCYAGLNMLDEIKTGRYSLAQKEIARIGLDDREFYKNFPLHEDFRGYKPYGENKIPDGLPF